MVNCSRNIDLERDITPEEHSANADLIAAAPDLLEAIEVVEWISSHGFTFCPYCNHTQQAGHSLDCLIGSTLKRARGES